MKALVLHAHPDDELIFAGALMLSRPDWEWTTVSLTGGARAAQYPGINLAHADEWRILTVPEFDAWKASVAALDLHPDIVFTHNLLGEYGHPHHMAVHRIAHELYANVWDFWCHAPSSIGRQVEGDHWFTVPVLHDKAASMTQRYGADTFRSLMAHQPDLMADQLVMERFTR